MAARVVDASALAAIVFGEPKAEAITGQLTGFRLVAPTLLPYEVANICLTKMRGHPTLHDEILASFELFSRMDIGLVEVETEEVIRLAEQVRLTAYDASYLWVAQKLQAELVTLDKGLRSAAASISARRVK